MAVDFRDHIVWITGGGSGLGREMALEFARKGADVAVSGRRKDRLDEVVDAVEELGTRGLAVPCDVTDEDEVDAAVAAVVEHFGKLDVAVANAGFGVAGAVEKVKAGEWRRQLETNVVGLTNTIRSAMPELRKTRGRIALVGSVAGLITTPGTGPYHASKFAVRAIGETLSKEIHGSGVTCTTVHPGFVASEIGRVDNQGRFDPRRKDKRPAKLMWQPDDAARVMVRAIYRRKREYTFTGHGKVFGFLGRHFPGLVHFVITRGSVKYERSESASREG